MAFQWEHEEDCKFYMGRPFSQVHAYLDECVKMYPIHRYGARHRGFRHNAYGVEHCKWKWGDEGELAAKIHIVRDYYGLVQGMELAQITKLADGMLY
jgi:hypothetical protein